MDENNAWMNFEQSGKITDYLMYKQSQISDTAITAGAIFHADQNKGDYSKTTQHW